jgi:pimeloyl-ACP methyl ester carboxylesterase
MNKTTRRHFLKEATAIGSIAVLPAAVGGEPKTRAELNQYARRAGPMDVPYVPHRDYAEGPFGQVHFRDTGVGHPLVLCHQAPHTSRQFTNIYEPLHRRGIRAIGVDMPGYGESDPTPFVPTIEDWATVIPAVLDHLGLDRVDVLGHHTGAMVATEVALQFPERVNKLVLNGPIPLGIEERNRFLEGSVAQDMLFEHKSDGSHLQDAFAIRNRMYGDGADPKTITRYTVERFQGYAPFWTGHHAAFIYDHGAAIERIKHATLILTNTGDQIYEHAKVTRKMRPDFAYTELAGGGIDIVDQMPEQWADAVVAFLMQ